MLTDVDMIVSLASYTERHKKKFFSFWFILLVYSVNITFK